MDKLLKGTLALGGVVGAVGIARRTVRRLRDPRYQPWEKAPYRDFPHKVLVLGGGFGGYTAAKNLCKLTRHRDDVGVMVISRENYFTFWPMLAGVISSDVETRNVAQPLRRDLIRLGASFRRAEVESIDLERQLVTAGDTEFPYDQLVVALGGEPAYFGIPGVQEHAISMKGIRTAEEIRNRVIERYEEYSLARGDVPQSKLTFVVIGGGATGVETASEIHSLVHDTISPDYPNINPNRVKVVLIDRGKQVLKELDPALRKAARRKLAELQIEVFNGVTAKEVTGEKVILADGREIETENVIWTAGARASETLEKLGLPHDERKGLTVDAWMRVEGYDNVWGIGDCAANVDEGGEAVPPNAQAAVQEGEAVAKNVAAAIEGREPAPFKYRTLGQLVELGGQFAVNDVLGVKFSGRLASFFWRVTYLYKTDSPQNQARIAVDWFLDLFFRPAVTQIRSRE
ncbi:MAG: NAD(P)/FAD-dependent oxidoreductase [Rubrobacteraceae bacterium]